LNWMIEGCLKWQKEGMQVPKDIIEATQEYKEDMDILGEFLALCCNKNKKGIVPNRWLYSKVYLAYCEIAGIRPLGQKAFSGSLRDRGIKIKHTNKGNACEGLELNCHLSLYLSQQETDAAKGVVTDVRDMIHFMKSFLSIQPHEDFTYNSSHPSLSFTNIINNKEVDSDTVKVKEEVKEEDKVKGNSSPTKIILENNLRQSEKSSVTGLQNTPPQLPNLTELIEKAQIRFQNEKGVINSSNITLFSIWCCDQFKPQWQANGESGYYTPSAIRGIASKMFGLTPNSKEQS